MSDTEKEIELLTQKIEANNEVIVNLVQENRSLQNTIGLLKLKQQGILKG